LSWGRKKRLLNVGPADLEAFLRSGLGSLAEFLKLPMEVRAELIVQNGALEDARARRLAIYVAGACSGAHLEVAGQADSEAPEEAGNLATLNAALGGGLGG
jgi:hypothetical protein